MPTVLPTATNSRLQSSPCPAPVRNQTFVAEISAAILGVALGLAGFSVTCFRLCHRKLPSRGQAFPAASLSEPFAPKMLNFLPVWSTHEGSERHVGPRIDTTKLNEARRRPCAHGLG